MDRLPQPETSLQRAIDDHIIDENVVTDVYTSLSELLENNPEYRRIILYLPFEFLPNASWRPQTSELQLATDRFQRDYLGAWQALLSTQDVRANFVDGDVLDPETRTEDLPRVVKAAHLIPQLVERGLLSSRDVLDLVEENDDPVLRHSIVDTLPVLADLKLLKDEDRTRIEASSDALLQNVAKEIESSTPRADERRSAAKPDELTPSALEDRFQTAFDHIDREHFSGITDQRAAWLRKEEKRAVLETVSDDLGAALVERALTAKALRQFLGPEVSTPSRVAFVDGIRKAIEAQTSPQRAHSLFADLRQPFLDLWEYKESEITDAVAKALYRLHNIGVIDDTLLTEHGLHLPELAGPATKNLESIPEELRQVRRSLATVEADPKLASRLYPVTLIFGSRLKGYGGVDADLDVGVFVKPGVPIVERAGLQTSLDHIFATEHVDGRVVEFWLEETADGLAVRTFDASEPNLGDRSWAHIIFGAAWEGDERAIQELREKLLVPYLYETDDTIHGRDARALELEEMERDALQYRLMHKGYEKFFPPIGGLQTAHSNRIDGQSMYWDSGYRRLATKLFARRVFLPKIPRP